MIHSLSLILGFIALISFGGFLICLSIPLSKLLEDLHDKKGDDKDEKQIDE